MSFGIQSVIFEFLCAYCDITKSLTTTIQCFNLVIFISYLVEHFDVKMILIILKKSLRVYKIKYLLHWSFDLFTVNFTLYLKWIANYFWIELTVTDFGVMKSKTMNLKMEEILKRFVHGLDWFAAFRSATYTRAWYTLDRYRYCTHLCVMERERENETQRERER